jgi:O-antigen/teichoic acid export membrane protein
VNSISASLLMASERNALLLGSEFAKVVLLLGGIWALSPWGPIPSAVAVAGSMALQAAFLVYMLGRSGFPVRELWGHAQGPCIAVVALVAAVVSVRWALDVAMVPVAAKLAAEVFAGAVAYCLAAWIFARQATRELLAVLQEQLRRLRPGAVEPTATDQSKTEGKASSP